MFLAAGLARVDNVFQMTRRLINAFKRPLGTSGSQDTVWHGYQPYNPAMIGKFLTILRTGANFISVGTDGKTPAMRLGLVQQSLTCEDTLWPGERAPRPRRVRLKGRRLSGRRRTPGTGGGRERPCEALLAVGWSRRAPRREHLVRQCLFAGVCQNGPNFA